jgi:2-desacetyl-2-hydroxyethyl bacteriochlorophyllide A dehydrogenase
VRAVVFPRVGSVEVRDVPEPEPRPGWLIVEVGACGICGTDLHILAGEFPLATYPCIPGHEFAGTVVAVGDDIDGFTVDDRVGVMPSVFCGTCHFCRNGRANLCERGGGFGTSLPGGFAERVAVLATHAYHLPDHLSFAEAAMIEPLACVVHGFHRLAPRAGQSYLVYGAGTMGLMLAQYARFAGGRTVALVDTNSAKLERAREFGFEVLGASFDDVRAVAPLGFDNVIEATGVTRVAEAAFEAVIRGGRLLLFGVCPPGEKAAYEPFRIYNSEIDVLGSMAVFDSYEPALEALAAGAIDARRMATHSFPIEGFPEALEVLRRGQGMKVQIVPAH